MAFRILNGIMAALFAFGAVVQYNDPDPLIWMLIYSAAFLVCLGVVIRGRVPLWAALGVGVIALLWGFFWSGNASVNEYLHMFDYWEMKSAPAEEARETAGLFIIAAWMGILSGQAWLTRRLLRAG